MSESSKIHKHIDKVRFNIKLFVDALILRAFDHDRSKLSEPEYSTFKQYTKRLPFGSEEYYARLKSMDPALDHHYSHNRHHPEYFADKCCADCGWEYVNDKKMCKCDSGYKRVANFSEMNLIDLMEMLSDWMSYPEYDTNKVIEMNQERFGYSNELKSILINTAKCIGVCNGK